MSENILEVKDLSVVRNGHTILEKVSFNVEVGDTLAIIGPNGAGKTTLFRAILNLIPYTGVVSWKEDIRIGYVPQKLYVGNDLPLTTLEFLRLKDSNFENIKSVLFSVGLNDKGEYIDSFEKHILQSRLGDLSGGELQRVLIAYALLGKPNVLLFDEPTAGIDVTGEETIYDLIHKLQAEDDLTIIFISHELQVVNHYANNVLCLNKEKISFGPPMTVVSRETLAKLYGEDVHLHKHEELTPHKHPEEHNHG